MAIDVLDRDDLPFPHSLPEFQSIFPDEVACAAYLEHARWSTGFVCRHCGVAAEPYRFANRPGVLRCRHCGRHQPYRRYSHGAHTHAALGVVLGSLPGASQTPGMSAIQFQRQLGLSRYETAF